MPDRSEEFYADCRVFVHRLAARTFSRDEADDITQEVMLRLVRHLPHLDVSQPIEPWLATVTRTVGISGRRARREVPARSDALDEGLGAGSDEPVLAVERADQAHFVHAALRRLSRSDAELLTRHELDEVSVAEIARAQGVAAAAIRQRLVRARRRLVRQYVALGGPRGLAWPVSPAAGWRWVRRHRRTRRLAVAGVAGAVVVAVFTGDGVDRLLPRPLPVPPPSPPAAVRIVVSGGGGPAAAAAAPAPGLHGAAGRRRPVEVSWQRVAGPDEAVPPPRRDASMTYDEARREYVLFGGVYDYDGTKETLGDTWTSPDGVRWTERETPVAPYRRSAAVMFYDPALRRVVLSGGRPAGVQVGDGRARYPREAEQTWAWDGASWAVLPQGERPGREVALYDGAGFAYDRGRRVGVQFGGRCDCSPPVRSETRRWVGGQWRDVAPRHVPPARDGAATAYDPARGEIVLFGGLAADGRTLLGDTWIWNGTDWRLVRPLRSPPPRQLGAMVTTGRGPVLLGGYGGRRNLRDAWLWTGTDWESLAVGRLAPAVSGGAVAYNPHRRELLLFSGDLAPKRRADAYRLPAELSEETFVATVTGDAGLPTASLPVPDPLDLGSARCLVACVPRPAPDAVPPAIRRLRR